VNRAFEGGSARAARTLAPLQAIACLAAAALAAAAALRSANSMTAHAGPAAPVSLAVASLLGSLFLIGFAQAVAAAIQPPAESRLSPKRLVGASLAAALLLLALSALVIRSERPTSFVSWDETRGLPLAWLDTGRFYGPCLDEGAVCRRAWPQSLRAAQALLNLLWIAAALLPLADRAASWWRNRRRTARSPAKGASLPGS